MDARDWIALASIASTLTIALVAQVLTVSRERRQQERDDRLRVEERAREDSIRQIERYHLPQIEFDIDCNFFGPEGDAYLVEVLLTVNNKGRVKQEFRDLTLRIRGIEKDKPLRHWENHSPRLEFPKALIENVPVVPDSVEAFYAEPGERHVFTYITKIPVSVKYILAYAEFSYDADTTHGTERVFVVKAT
jgi:hypothetical protein